MRTALLALFIAASISNLHAQEDALKHSVVVFRDANNTILGTGIIVGADPQRIYIGTAEHVTRNTAFTVEMYGARGKTHSARALPETGVDFAIVVVDVPADDAVRTALSTISYREGSAPRGTKVWNIGHSDGLWESSSRVNEVLNDVMSTITFSNLGILEGSSGGPLFDDQNRLIGMVTEISGARGKALMVEQLVKLLALWNVPTNLLAKSGASSPQQGPGKGKVAIVCNVDACEMKLDITIGGVVFHATGQRYDAAGVPLGAMSYEVKGDITRREGSCNATGAGKLHIKEGHLIEVSLNRNPTAGHCSLRLWAKPDVTTRAAVAEPARKDCLLPVRTTPDGVHVFVEGMRKGVTPTTLQLTPGVTVAVRLQKDGYRPEEVVANCSMSSIKATLVTEGRVSVRSRSGCGFKVTLKIGDRSFPVSEIPTHIVVPTGEVLYEISGETLCSGRACIAAGKGTITVNEGDVLLLWPNQRGVDRCEVTLEKDPLFTTPRISSLSPQIQTPSQTPACSTAGR